MALSTFFGCNSLAHSDPNHLPPSTGEGRGRGAKKITPTLVLPRREGGRRTANSLTAERFASVLAFLISSLLGTITSLLAQDKKPVSFSISYASVSGTRAPLWIAKDLGLFEKYGLDAAIISTLADEPDVSPISSSLTRRSRMSRDLKEKLLAQAASARGRISHCSGFFPNLA